MESGNNNNNDRYGLGSGDNALDAANLAGDKDTNGDEESLDVGLLNPVQRQIMQYRLSQR